MSMPAHASPTAPSPANRAAMMPVNGVQLTPMPEAALWWPQEGLLAVADLHFEKGSAFAARGQMLPPYDTRATLARLETVIARLRPRTVIALGDSFHDMGADGRIQDDDARRLTALVRSVTDWVWIEGNHDPVPPPRFGGRVTAELRLGPLVFRHLPVEGPAPGEIAGHLHPCAKVRGQGRAVRARCFATDGARAILPAFGAFTGGLNICDPAFTACFGRRPDARVIGRGRVYAVPAGKLSPDA